MSGRREVTDPIAIRKLADLEVLAHQIAQTEKLYEERTTLFAELRDMGVTMREIAQRAGVTEMAVAKALRKAREAA